MKHKQKEEPLISFIVALVIVAITVFVFLMPHPPADAPTISLKEVPNTVYAMEVEVESKPIKTFKAKVTGYNTVPAQTDSTPCIAASGDNICGRDDVLACPSEYPLGSIFEIGGKEYTCLDRTAAKYNGRFDISCDKDFECPYRVHGTRNVHFIR